jgi:hypothetical protein
VVLIFCLIGFSPSSVASVFSGYFLILMNDASNRHPALVIQHYLHIVHTPTQHCFPLRSSSYTAQILNISNILNSAASLKSFMIISPHSIPVVLLLVYVFCPLFTPHIPTRFSFLIFRTSNIDPKPASFTFFPRDPSSYLRQHPRAFPIISFYHSIIQLIAFFFVGFSMMYFIGFLSYFGFFLLISRWSLVRGSQSLYIPYNVYLFLLLSDQHMVLCILVSGC